MGYYTPNKTKQNKTTKYKKLQKNKKIKIIIIKKKTCFVLFLKISINTFLKNNICIFSKLSKELKMALQFK